MDNSQKLQIQKLWADIKSMKRHIEALEKKVKDLTPPMIEYDSEDIYDEDVVNKYLRPTALKDVKEQYFNNDEGRYIEL